MKRKTIIALLSMCMLMSACADNGDTQLPEISVITNNLSSQAKIDATGFANWK